MRNKLLMSLLLLILALPKMICAQGNSNNILKSNNIQEIENYLKIAHPDDPKRMVLKPRLIALKNKDLTKGKSVPKLKESIVNNHITISKPVIDESQEFNRLIMLTSQEHSGKTVKLLNTMFNEDIDSNEAILLFKNQSDCNLILRINGKENYSMAVPTHGENFIVVNKDSYNLTANVCHSSYSSYKDVRKGMVITIANSQNRPENNIF
ncbi:DUF6759 domain-containing protein [Chryseobacterium fistulae]|uniref:DUF6759 domain-containing protein n=1 Tax=Chryseobacterium fistulae TaxID=2675058 RepID=A0A6N4XS19_9FLAO|nr:DUF6759 domain-containing protein [Chryseobacterium fistulae]CAA7391428.1 hypothetical protein CHRY9393_02917 [Chryseobacterium fistulae]